MSGPSNFLRAGKHSSIIKTYSSEEWEEKRQKKKLYKELSPKFALPSYSSKISCAIYLKKVKNKEFYVIENDKFKEFCAKLNKENFTLRYDF